MASYISYINPFNYFGNSAPVKQDNNNNIQVVGPEIEIEEEQIELSEADLKHNASVDQKLEALETRFAVTEGRMQQAMNMEDGPRKDAKIQQILQKFNQLGEEKARLLALYRV